MGGGGGGGCGCVCGEREGVLWDGCSVRVGMGGGGADAEY